MNITPDQAAAALQDIQQTERHSRALRSYQMGSPFLVLWGVIWAVGYTATGLAPSHAWMTWPLLTAAGITGNIVLRRGQLHDSSPAVLEYLRVLRWRTLGSYAALALFWFGVYAVLQPHTLNQYCAFPAILMGAIYTVMGLWMTLHRYVWLGAAVSLLTLAGYFYLSPWFAFWMAAVGGGGLILGGFWMRKV